MYSNKTSKEFPIAEVTIESLGGLGDGIATFKNKPLFISKACIGDSLRVRITETKSDHRRGHIMDVLAPGEHRVTAPCRYYDECGGCSLMHFSESAYQEFKRRNFQSSLRQGGFPGRTADMVFLPAATRRRVEFKLASTPQGATLAYYRQRSHDLVAVAECLILEHALQTLIKPLAQALSDFPGAAYITSVSLTSADSGMDMALGIRKWENDYSKALAEIAKNLGFQRISATLPEEKCRSVIELSPVEMHLGNYAIALPPDAFLQATREAQKLLTEQVTKAVKQGDHVADLFCGIGTYSFPLVDVATVHAVENDETMIASLENSIRRHKLGKKLSAEHRDLFKNPLPPAELNRFDTVVINPPRIGAKKQCEELAKSKVKTLVMVSCNHATWARDAKILKNGGFELESALGIDQFVFSPHFEIVSVFRR